MIKIQEYLDNHLEQSLPFVLYAKPNSSVLVGFFQHDYQIYKTANYLDAGFVFAPFSGTDSVLFPVDKCEVLLDSIADLQINLTDFTDKLPSQAAQKKHLDLVEKGVAAILRGDFKKVVLSRKETLFIEDPNFMLYFKRLLTTYPTAFRYLFFHPQVGIWIGASPEQLLKQKGNYIETVALAGTQVKPEISEVQWSEKEKDEQKIVTDYIIKNLEPFISELEISQPYTAQAGSLFHIKTDIKAKLSQANYFVHTLLALHPTPALCGYPKQAATDFILNHEGYDREFYSGFLGELNFNPETKQDTESEIFVNLRCMQLEYKKVHVYIGGGITAQSNPEAEFLETVNKTKTIKKILGS